MHMIRRRRHIRCALCLHSKLTAMKKIYSLFIALTALMFLSACSVESGLDPENPQMRKVFVNAQTAQTKTVLSYDNAEKEIAVMWEDGDDICWQKVFYTSDDPFGHLFEGADKLYELIEISEYDAKLTPNIHQLITKYVEGGRPD